MKLCQLKAYTLKLFVLSLVFLCTAALSKNNKYVAKEHSLIIDTDSSIKMQLDFFSEEVVRVWISPDGTFSKTESYAVSKEEFLTNYEIKEFKDYLIVETKKIKIKIKNNLIIDFYDKNDLPLALDHSVDLGCREKL